ncbi:uncharacterized protein LOC129718608 [Wyeomyia smithii]|uniref:uncharacterized protein LOC129718608 n=1 Tax=Wyeomyia smithii TaxID=174621 RepID=UPI002467BF7F|nr:uncharacterized protein LOC129718608 [Wyeomyia smithii]
MDLKSDGSQVEREINECIAVKDWRKVIEFGQEAPFEERVKFLWVWPLQEDLERIQICFARLGISRVLSIGCGTGLLEWLITSATGIHIAGVEKDENWWRSKHATTTYIPMQFAEALRDVSQGWHALMFCYFNDGCAFREYVRNFNGCYVIIIGPRDGKGIHTDPMPFDVKFPSEQSWEWVCQFRIGNENRNHVVIYQKQ